MRLGTIFSRVASAKPSVNAINYRSELVQYLVGLHDVSPFFHLGIIASAHELTIAERY
jgi:hypothetical protein